MDLNSNSLINDVFYYRAPLKNQKPCMLLFMMFSICLKYRKFALMDSFSRTLWKIFKNCHVHGLPFLIQKKLSRTEKWSLDFPTSKNLNYFFAGSSGRFRWQFRPPFCFHRFFVLRKNFCPIKLLLREQKKASRSATLHFPQSQSFRTVWCLKKSSNTGTSR